MLPNGVASALVASAMAVAAFGLGDDDFKVREACQATSSVNFPYAEAFLRNRYFDRTDLEASARAGAVLESKYAARLAKRVAERRVPSVTTLPNRHKNLRNWLYFDCINDGFADTELRAMCKLAGQAPSFLVWDYFDLRAGDTPAVLPAYPPDYTDYESGSSEWPTSPTEVEWLNLIREIRRE